MSQTIHNNGFIRSMASADGSSAHADALQQGLQEAGLSDLPGAGLPDGEKADLTDIDLHALSQALKAAAASPVAATQSTSSAGFHVLEGATRPIVQTLDLVLKELADAY